jgi:hypothetical protein
MRRPLAALTVVAGIAAFAAQPAGAAIVLRQNGIGPLKLGMTRAAALRTRWLAHKAPGCELASPRPVTYQLNGSHAPAGLRGSVEFTSNKLSNVSVSRGGRTALGVAVGYTSVPRMVSRYRAAGFHAKARFDSTFQATFVDVTRNGKPVIEGLAEGPVISLLAIPFVPTCD